MRRTYECALAGENEPASDSTTRCTLLAAPGTVLNQRLRAAAARPGPSIRAVQPDLQVAQLPGRGVATRSEFGRRGPRESARARSRRNRLVLRSCRRSVTLGARTPPPGRRTRAAGARLLCVGSRTGAQHDGARVQAPFGRASLARRACRVLCVVPIPAPRCQPGPPQQAGALTSSERLRPGYRSSGREEASWLAADASVRGGDACGVRPARGGLPCIWVARCDCVRATSCCECALVWPRAISVYHVPTVGQRMAWIPPLYRRVRLSDDGKVRSQVCSVGRSPDVACGRGRRVGAEPTYFQLP